MNINRNLAATAAITAVLALGAQSGQAKADSVEIGLLECAVEGGTGFVFGSSRNLFCEFMPTDDGGFRERYTGTISKFGIDIGFTDSTLVQWLVLAPTTDYEYTLGSLAGTYRGVSAEASAAAGAGVNVLVGGSNNTISLQPVSLQTQEGVNIAVGVAELDLRPVSN